MTEDEMAQASLSITNSWSSLKLMSIELVMPSHHLILCRSLLLPSSIFPSIGVFSDELVLHIRWPKYWSFSFSINPSNEYSGLISFRMDWQCGRPGFDPWIGKILWRREWLPTPVVLPGEFQGQRSQVIVHGAAKSLDTTE